MPYDAFGNDRQFGVYPERIAILSEVPHVDHITIMMTVAEESTVTCRDSAAAAIMSPCLTFAFMLPMPFNSFCETFII